MAADLTIDPCPFCGGEGRVLFDNKQQVYGVTMTAAVVECKKCSARGTPAVDVGITAAKELAVHNWNTRSERSEQGG